MKILLLCLCLMLSTVISANGTGKKFETIYIKSRIKNLKLALIHIAPKKITAKIPILFIHGSSFPVELAFGFRMNGHSWMDDLANAGYDVYSIDFLGYGASDRYPEMSEPPGENKPLGRAKDVFLDIDKAVGYLIKRTGSKKVNIIAHSWGGSAAALYTQNFQDKINKLILFSPITVSLPTNKDTESVNVAYDELTPAKRIELLKTLTPKGEKCRLEDEIFSKWGSIWMKSALPFQKHNHTEVLFPAGPDVDIMELENGHSYYNPDSIFCPTLLIRGEWDNSPSWEEAQRLFNALTNAKHKRYIVIEKGTHVMHLEKSRFQLYKEVRSFLEENFNNDYNTEKK